MIVTFYSYKGGVGRSMALANVACQLANRHGLRVLAIDWDLEAPGLHFYFGHQDASLRRRKGLVDLLLDTERTGESPELKRYTMPAAGKIFRQIKFGSVDLIPCGRLDGSYMERVAEFNWPSFYDNHNAFDRFDELKDLINSRYDICLIDARAGQSDSNVPPTTQLADLLVLLFTSNDQSLSGTAELCRRFRDARDAGFNLKQAPVILVPSRVFPLQASYHKWLTTSAEPIYRKLLEEGVVGPRDQPNGLSHVTLPVEPGCAAGEQLPILDPSQASLGLVAGYRDLVDLLLDHKNDDDLLWRPDRMMDSGELTDLVVGKLRGQLKEAAERGDEPSAALIRLRLARYLREINRSAEAESLALSSLTYFKSREDIVLQPLALHTLGQINVGRGEFERAIENYSEALELIDVDDFRRAVLLHDIGVANLRLGRMEKAHERIDASIRIKERLGDLRGLALSVHQLANIAMSINRSDEAARLFNEASEIAIKGHDELGAAISIHQLGNLRARERDFDGALALFFKSLALHEGRRNLRGSAITRRRIGDMYTSKGDDERALKSYYAALDAAQTEGDLRSIQAIHRRIGETLIAEDKLEDARDQLVAAVSVAEGLALRHEAARSLLKLAQIELRMGRRFAAQAYLERAGEEGVAEPTALAKERASTLAMFESNAAKLDS